MIIDCVADLHGYYPKLEGGDLLIVAGDLTARDEQDQYLEFGNWLKEQKYTKKVLIAGNHDGRLQKITMSGKTLHFPFMGCDYLFDSGTEIEGFKIWGSPWTLKFPGMNPKCMAFTCDIEEELMDKWDKIPHDTDILITHSPAFGILDGIPLEDGSLYHAGSKGLFGWLKYVERPKLHVFGHIHEGFGQAEEFLTYNDKMMKSINASYVDEHYKPVNKPIRVVL